MSEEPQALEPKTTEAQTRRRVPRRKDEYVTFRFRRSRFIAASIALAFIFGFSLGYGSAGRGDGGLANSSLAPENPTRLDVSVSDTDPTLGSPDAAITIIEFSDFECPFCRRHNQEVFPQIMAAYSDRIYYVFKDYPLTNIHPNAIPAAEAAHCAQAQGEFWAYHDLLFSMRLELGREAYLAYAGELGLDLADFTDCVDNRRYADEVRADLNLALQLNLRATPAFVINGRLLYGAQPFEIFAEIIEAELAARSEIPTAQD